MIVSVEVATNNMGIQSLYYDEGVDGFDFGDEQDVIEFILDSYNIFPYEWYDCHTGEKEWRIIPFSTLKGMEYWINTNTGLRVKINTFKSKN